MNATYTDIKFTTEFCQHMSWLLRNTSLLSFHQPPIGVADYGVIFFSGCYNSDSTYYVLVVEKHISASFYQPKNDNHLFCEIITSS